MRRSLSKTPEPSPLPLGSQREQKLSIKISNIITIEYEKLTVVSRERHNIFLIILFSLFIRVFMEESGIKMMVESLIALHIWILDRQRHLPRSSLHVLGQLLTKIQTCFVRLVSGPSGRQYNLSGPYRSFTPFDPVCHTITGRCCLGNFGLINQCLQSFLLDTGIAPWFKSEFSIQR